MSFKHKVEVTVFGFDVSKATPVRHTEPQVMTFHTDDGSAALYLAFNLAYYGPGCAKTEFFTGDKMQRMFPGRGQ